MTLLFSDGLDGHIALADRWDTVNGSATIVTDGGKFGAGTNSLKFPGVVQSNTVSVNSAPTNPRGGTLNPLHLAFYVKMPNNTSTEASIFAAYDTAEGFGIQITTSGIPKLTLHASSFNRDTTSGSIAGTASTSLTDGEWHHIEVVYVADNSAGIAKMWVDSVLEINFSGDTIISGSVPSGTGYELFAVSSAWSTNVEFDDLLIWDEEGSSMNTSSQLTLHRIETLTPNGAGNSTQFSVTGAASNYLAVDEFGADDDTTYVSSSTNGNVDLYTYSNMAGTPSVIHGVLVNSITSNNSLGAISMKNKVRQNAVDGSGATLAVTAGGVYTNKKEFFAQNPDGPVAWTKATVDAAEFGVEVVV